MGSQNVMAIQAMLIDRKQFQRLLGIKKSAFFDWKKRDPNFPQPLRFSGGHTVRWRLSDAMEYIAGFQAIASSTAGNGGAQ